MPRQSEFKIYFLFLSWLTGTGTTSRRESFRWPPTPRRRSSWRVSLNRSDRPNSSGPSRTSRPCFGSAARLSGPRVSPSRPPREIRSPAPEIRLPPPEIRLPPPEIRLPAPEIRLPLREIRLPVPEIRPPPPGRSTWRWSFQRSRSKKWSVLSFSSTKLAQKFWPFWNIVPSSATTSTWRRRRRPAFRLGSAGHPGRKTEGRKSRPCTLTRPTRTRWPSWSRSLSAESPEKLLHKESPICVRSTEICPKSLKCVRSS